MGTLLGKLVFQLHFYYLYSLKKLKWSAIKAAPREWACITSLKLEEPRTIYSSKVASMDIIISTHLLPSNPGLFVTTIIAILYSWLHGNVEVHVPLRSGVSVDF